MALGEVELGRQAARRFDRLTGQERGTLLQALNRAAHHVWPPGLLRIATSTTVAACEALPDGRGLLVYAILTRAEAWRLVIGVRETT